ncbi:FHA domain-containing protein [Nocardioides bizhenqiangii]|uniref:FHA domain-containing protein n=1 Tax=Nocardioides bizhenqiangii TaxID=3095076 RepID=A0ABZ0ZUP9_9ACTN|nr:FHA domain-containing protein [Nocardioides sp. HM61]WQQ27978.1 FHA domain-containing protein [Nocardioides sp. HM61]
MPTCPSGHDSTADDYCDVCGLPITDAGSAPPPAGDAPAAPPETDVPTPAAPAGATCPNCSALNPENALFCEACGYDFTTGQAPRTPSPLDLDAAAPPATSTPSPPPAEATPAAGDPPTSEAQRSIAPPLTDAWMAEVWIDPDWYAEQDSSDPLPSAGVPTVVPLKTTSILVGRTSRSRNIHPDIDLSTDNGISRRHCQFTTDGSRWWVEDLGSSNGTYVGGPIGPLPTQPLSPGAKREIAADERVYLGAWSRIVIRKAAPGEL